MLNTLRPPVGLAICFFSLLTLGGAGCAINVNLPANRFDSPETRGELLHGSIDMAVAGSNTLQILPDPNANPIQTTSPGWDRSNASFRLGGSLGLFERLDAGVKASWNGPTLIQLKYQLLGAPELKAQSGNFAVAVTAGAGTTQPSSDAAMSANGISSHTTLSFASYDAALIAGYRIAETLMIYGGPFFSTYSYSSTVTQGGAVNSAFPVSGNGTQSGGNLGVQLDSVLGAIKLEEAWALASVSGIQQSGFYTGACLSFRF